MNNNLKPCPFCGSEAIIKTNTGNIETASWFWVECKNDECEYINISPCKTQEQAETDWNTRPLEDALQARIAELDKEIETWKAGNKLMCDTAMKQNHEFRLTMRYANETIELKKRIEELENIVANYQAAADGTTHWCAECKMKDDRIAELEKQVEWHLFDIDNVDTYPPCADMYLTLSIPERTEYREIDNEETYDVLWFELYSEEYWHKHNVTHWAYLPAPPKEEK